MEQRHTSDVNPIYEALLKPQQPPSVHLSHAKHPSEAYTENTLGSTYVQSSSSRGSGSLSESPKQGKQRSYNGPNVNSTGMQHNSWSDLRQSSYPSSRVHAHHRWDDEEEDHALWIVFWLSALDPVYSLAGCVFTLVTTVTLILASPIRLAVRSQTTLKDQLVRSLAPFLRHHLEMMYAPSKDEAFAFEFNVIVLVAVQMAAPMVSIGVMFATWVSGAFWVFAFMMGNPDGTEKCDDGAAAVIAVRDWWERYFLQSLNRHSRTLVRLSV